MPATGSSRTSTRRRTGRVGFVFLGISVSGPRAFAVPSPWVTT